MLRWPSCNRSATVEKIQYVHTKNKVKMGECLDRELKDASGVLHESGELQCMQKSVRN